MTARFERRHLLRGAVLAYIGVMLIAPVSVILYRTFRPGLGHFWAWVSTPAAISALKLSLLLVVIVVPLNALFGVVASILLVRNRFWGRSALQAVIDLPFAVSPIIVGVALIALWGSSGALGFVENHLGFKIIFGLPGMVLASIFVTLPFVVREVQPVLMEVGIEQEQAAATLGANSWQTLWRITLPSIRWGLTYGVVLTTARTLGEFGAVIMVSSNLPGGSQTLTLLVNDRYHRGAEYGAYALSTLLMGVAVAFLIAKTMLLAYRNRTRALDWLRRSVW
ncbi:sulfate ABC transporter permease subunit CysW [Mycolicibacter sinensis]|uniref:Sulfate ABC transporter permease subunit CysW n=1 Tax=Mycolicibacter sinensis (strain JDM601) TaxID=875328 RepID=A0A1A2NQ26_MYCSD|nr:sulfate ABC transporter permease subunit CysW [Mycolicibacter sinensis]OBH17176.1 sulfate ABC transporter permease subunit CysW [Mycolicibacter sinensis]OBI29121.1 sulfate ABC transporter permease subunit CysW [Mycolicibacter sinensis]